MRISYKADFFEEVKRKITSQGFRIVGLDPSQSWGGSLMIDESQAQRFADLFFQDILQAQSIEYTSNPSKPKVLVIEPKQAIAWQYHQRRVEWWQVIAGEVGVIISDDDEERKLLIKQPKDILELKPGKRHRLVGLDDWAVIAQLWNHVDLRYPSDDADVIRLKL
ncbi:phosphoheptose isomerase [Olivibacter sp. CPCC 100613]|uniref:cupin domain-containing protein n=1 Tax=Olivibacter sp. CPCC 100613 TaxID=3079931 RepID=UPI002FFA3DCD